MRARDYLCEHLEAENREYFGVADLSWLSAVCDAWMNDDSNSGDRYDDMRLLISDENLKKMRILDMASGCGTFVFYGLLNGYDVYGIEPEDWKHRFNAMKAKERSYPSRWMQRFFRSFGEALPFKDQSFDIVSSYQTLEHVQSQEKCIDEMKRVLKPGGYVFIRCPDYTSWFEGHYRIPMLPLMNKKLFKQYLKMLGRPKKGLETIQYIHRRKLESLLKPDCKVVDLSVRKTAALIKRKISVYSKFLAYIWLFSCRVIHLFSCENTLNLAAVKKR